MKHFQLVVFALLLVLVSCREGTAEDSAEEGVPKEIVETSETNEDVEDSIEAEEGGDDGEGSEVTDGFEGRFSGMPELNSIAQETSETKSTNMVQLLAFIYHAGMSMENASTALANAQANNDNAISLAAMQEDAVKETEFHKNMMEFLNTNKAAMEDTQNSNSQAQNNTIQAMQSVVNSVLASIA